MPFIIPDVVAMQGVKQNQYHIKNVFGHTMDVLERAARVETESALVLRLAALLHDVGKHPTMTNDNGEIHFYGHQIVGARIAERILRGLRYDEKTVGRVSKLIEMHMAVLELRDTGMSTKSIRRFARKVDSDLDLLFELALADVKTSNKDTSAEICRVRSVVLTEIAASKPQEMVSPLNGKELIDIFGLTPGPEVGRIKALLLDAVVDGVLEPDDKPAAMAFVRERLENHT
jgi:poly(A) polymerase